ncbi:MULTISPECIES: hypothetical protein [Streptomyces]|uniref:Integral membrane protein n=1 Tax=Streptomyces evansiae TaxID=3075535 RepID=A0ABU2QXT5_9ACTN|nr:MULTISPECIES: hypothetical protein [unclassified Streptomyces]MDT0409236.1 hypothetical protein [Streptomyces sp. DSM 41979]MYQ56746.1 hypothetical protein [Streptomyces sp. SID4926]SCE32602.1 hypothetical protein GA0115252_14166 [Streptomyces sp. DfronAA-171]
MTAQTVTAPTSHERFLRLALALQTLTVLFQAVSAGLLLTTSYGETLHSVGARVMYAAAMLYVLAAVLAWKPGVASPRHIWCATGFLALASAQVVLGIRHVAEVHVPLGVTMFALSVLALVFRWVPSRRDVTGRP